MSLFLKISFVLSIAFCFSPRASATDSNPELCRDLRIQLVQLAKEKAPGSKQSLTQADRHYIESRITNHLLFYKDLCGRLNAKMAKLLLK